MMRCVLSKRWRAPWSGPAYCVVLGLALAAGLPATPAAAQGTPAQRAACEQDAYRLCMEFVPDEPRIANCLSRKRMSLSRACRALFTGKSSRRARASSH
jgi:hypothetical protein